MQRRLRITVVPMRRSRREKEAPRFRMKLYNPIRKMLRLIGTGKSLKRKKTAKSLLR